MILMLLSLFYPVDLGHRDYFKREKASSFLKYFPIISYQDHNAEALARSEMIQEWHALLLEPYVYKVNKKLWFENYGLWDLNQRVSDKQFIMDLQSDPDIRKTVVIDSRKHSFARPCYVTNDHFWYQEWKVKYRQLGHSPDIVIPEKMAEK